MTANEAVTPGCFLGTLSQYQPGEGVYVREDKIYSSLVGFKTVLTSPQHKTPVIAVIKHDETPAVIPSIKSVVIARVTKVNPRFATVLILCVAEKVLSEPFQGIIRATDVRQTQVDQVEMYKCFRPGDIIRAEVISLGNSRSYYLSTAKNEYGVIYAKSVAGATMIPISWNLMQCPKTKIKEYRKVAKTL